MSPSKVPLAIGATSVCRSLRDAMRGLSYVGADSLSDEEAERMWICLRDAFQQIFNHNAASLSFEELYRYAYTLVLHKRGQKLYEGAYFCLEAQLREVAASLQGQEEEDAFLKMLLKRWNEHAVNLGLASDVLMYLDKNFVPQHRLTPVYAMGMQLFYHVVLREASIRARLRDRLLGLVLADRNGEKVDLEPLRQAVHMLISLHASVGQAVYTEEFEAPFLAATRAFYEEESERYVRGASATDFLKQAREALLLFSPTKKVAAVLNEQTGAPLSQLLYELWIGAHYASITADEASGGPFLIRNNHIEDLHRMFCLFSRVREAVERLQSMMRKCLEEEGQAILNDPGKSKDAVSFVSFFLSLKNKYLRIVKGAFCDSQGFHATMKSAFEGFLCAEPRSPCFLASYLDEFFRKGAKTASDQEVQETLEGLLALFRYLRDKDVFAAYYKQLLSRRLLQNRTANIEAEKDFVDRLRAECGQQYTAKLESMFRDLLVAGQLRAEFSKYKLQLSEGFVQGAQQQWGPGFSGGDGGAGGVQHQLSGAPFAADAAALVMSEDVASSAGECEGRGPESEVGVSGSRQGAGCHGLRNSGVCTPEFECTVLTQATWFTSGDCISDLSLVPPSLHWPVDAFTSFYAARHSGRVLKFALEEGRALLRGSFAASRHELECSTLQMCILCFFNENPSVTVGQLLKLLKDKSGPTFPEAELRRQLTSLCTPKCRLLSRRSGDGPAATRELQDADVLEVNANFSSRLMRIKVPLVTLASLGGGSDIQVELQAGADVPSSVEQDRNHLVEAAIVRVLKGRQQILHNELVTEEDVYVCGVGVTGAVQVYCQLKPREKGGERGVFVPVIIPLL
ncbi:hypothetical protein Esti_002011 [Eimeria stiedai]